MVAACFMTMFIHSGVGFYAFSVFFTPIENEFGWSRATISAAMSLGALLSGFASPFIGRWTETLGPRKVIITGAVIMGSGLIALNGVTALWQLFAFFILATVGRMALSGVPIGTVVGQWFRYRRGMALGIAATGIGVGGLIMAPVAEFLISHFGWRIAIAALGLLTIAIVAPLVGFIVRRTPQEMGLQPYQRVVEKESEEPVPLSAAVAMREEESVTYQQAFRTPAFWMISGALFLISFGQGSALLHTVPLFVDRGMSPDLAATILALTSGMGGAGKFTMGFISDKFPPRFVMLTCFLLQALGLVMLVLPDNPLTVPSFIIFYGMGMGGVYALQPMIAAETFGTAALGTILGTIVLPASVSQALGPIVAGYIYDTTRSYNLAFGLFITLAIFAAISIFAARPVVGPKRQVSVVRN